MDHRPDLTLVGPATPTPEEQGGPLLGHDQPRPPALEPVGHGVAGGAPNGHRRSLSPLPTTRDDAADEVDVVDVQTDQLADADPGRVEQLQGGPVAQVDRVVVVRRDLAATSSRAAADRWVRTGGSVRCRLGAAQPQGRVGVDPTGALEPAEEGPQRGRRARDRGPRRPPTGRRRPARPRRSASVTVRRPSSSATPTAAQEDRDVAEVGPNGVPGATALGAQVALER